MFAGCLAVKAMSQQMVLIGGMAVGGGSPVSIQSMTNTDTRDIEATVAQINALQQAGCEIVRISVYDELCAKALKLIKNRTKIPVVADIHFDFRLAIMAAENGADKLRINPGNIGNAANVKKLADAAKSARIPIRVGANSGSLPSDLLQKHNGPTAEALLESALRHAALLEQNGFADIVLSLKSADVSTNVAAYRLAAKSAGYPLHIGVTEAGCGDDALVKSSIGIGALLLDGIGDTIRVSITGDPICEIVAAKRILNCSGIRRNGIEIIACPTCGRCGVDLLSIVRRIEKKIPVIDRHIRLAIMGCAVNGPGEAKESDLGIAFGDGRCVLFRHGEIIRTFDADEAECVILDELNALIRE